MTIVDDTKTTVRAVLDSARALAPDIVQRAPEIERARRLPIDLLDELIAAGCFRLLVPTSHGGIGADLKSGLRVFEELARADGSVGWTVMIGAGRGRDLAALPRASFDSLFPSARDFIVAGAFNPTGTITATEDDYRVDGRWAFASGCEHARWMWANCVEGVVDGIPSFRMAVFSPDEVAIEDTWTVLGMAGTGSHHFHVSNVVVAADRTFRPFVDEPCLDEPVVRIPPPTMFALAIVSVALGIAQGALDDIRALAADKTGLLATAPLATNSLFQFGLASAHTEMRAARVLVGEQAESAWAIALTGRELTLDERAQFRAAAAWATERARATVTFAHLSGGSSSIYASSPLQRRLRDIHTLTQHFLVKSDTLTTAGAIFAGEDLSVPVF